MGLLPGLVAGRDEDRLRQLSRRQQRALLDGRRWGERRAAHCQPGIRHLTGLVARRSYALVPDRSRRQLGDLSTELGQPRARQGYERSQPGRGYCLVPRRDEDRLPGDRAGRMYSDIFLMNADGTDIIRLTANTGPDWTPAWSP